MKFKYDLSESAFKCMNLAYGIYFKKKVIRKYKNKKNHGFVFYMIMSMLLLFLMFIVIACIIGFVNPDKATVEKFLEISSNIFTYLFVIPFFFLVYFIINYIIFKIRNVYSGSLIVDETGIADISDEITVKFTWNKIDSIFILEDLIVIICNSYVFQIIYANIKNPKRFINAVKKYSEETLIVDTTKK